MSGKQHQYSVTVEWQGNRGTGTSSYRAYGREHRLASGNKPDIAGSSDPAFLGDPAKWNPEDMLIGATSACHQLWYLHLCAAAGIVVESYVDHAQGTMTEHADGGRFTSITLRPVVTIRSGDSVDRARDLHHEAHRQCFIANSLAVPITCEPEIRYPE